MERSEIIARLKKAYSDLEPLMDLKIGYGLTHEENEAISYACGSISDAIFEIETESRPA